MGGTTFENLVRMADPNEAFRAAVEEARHESGHGGYTGTIGEKPGFVIIQREPVTPEEAYRIAERLVDDGDPRIDDKWGDAGAIPVVTGIRTERIGSFEGSVEAWRADSKAEATAVLRARKKLHRGESVRSARLTSYSTVDTGPSYARRRGDKFTNGFAEVEINKPGGPYSRKVTVKIDFKGLVDHQNSAKWTPLVDAKVKLKPGEKIVDRRPGQNTPVTRVRAEATKGKAETRYFALLDGHNFSKNLWERGHPTQAAARAAAVAECEKPVNAFGRAEVGYEIVAVTRREGNQPLVTVSREVTKSTAEVEVTITSRPEGPADAWLFFGWASC